MGGPLHLGFCCLAPSFSLNFVSSSKRASKTKLVLNKQKGSQKWCCQLSALNIIKFFGFFFFFRLSYLYGRKNRNFLQIVYLTRTWIFSSAPRQGSLVHSRNGAPSENVSEIKC